MRVACIGSREISKETAIIMTAAGALIAKRGDFVASGNALGSDAAYAHGANTINPRQVILYLPWSSYNEEQIVEGNRVTTKILPAWEVIARAYHPVFNDLPQGAQKMMIRNAGIVMRADKVIAYLNHGKKGGGGTGHGWRIAEALGLPRLDLAVPENQDLQKIKTFLYS